MIQERTGAAARGFAAIVALPLALGACSQESSSRPGVSRNDPGSDVADAAVADSTSATAGDAGASSDGGPAPPVMGGDDAGGNADGAVPVDNPPPPLTGKPIAATVKVTRGTAMGKLQPGAAGFSFEKSHMSDGFFSPAHAPLIAMFKLLGPGVVRIGADDVNKSVWTPSATFVTPGTTSPDVGTAEVDALAQFLTATGWKAIYAVNMLSPSTPQTAVTELTYVVPKLGTGLAGVEIGNELNLYTISNPQGVWQTFAQAIRKAFPSTPIAGPGAFDDVGYATKFISGEATLIDLVTHHYYRGTAGNSNATVANLAQPDPTVVSDSQSLASSVQTNGIPLGYRYGETNTYSSHGEAGISDALISALWGVNFLLTTAEGGAAGANFHGGGQNMDGNDCPNGVSSCTKPFLYSPLVEVDSRVTAAAPLYYGMLLVSQIGAGDMLPTTIASAGSTELRAYTVTPSDGTTRVVLVNSEASTGVNATVDVGAAVASATAVYLSGPSLTSTTGTTLAGASVGADGTWAPQPAFTLGHSGTTISVPVPAASAVLLTAR